MVKSPVFDKVTTKICNTPRAESPSTKKISHSSGLLLRAMANLPGRLATSNADLLNV